MILRSLNGIGEYSADHGAHVVAHDPLNEAIALRRCAMYRNAFRGFAIGYPAASMRLDAIAGWIRRQGVTVDVADVDDLDWTAIARIHPSHIVMHGFDEVSGPIALGYGVSRLIVDSTEQVAVLRASVARPQAVLVDVTDTCLDAATMADSQIAIDGLHCRAVHGGIADLAEIVFGLVADMAQISHDRGIVLSRLSVGDVDLTGWDHDPRSLRGVAETIDEAVEDACVQFQFARPAMTVSPRPGTLVPAA